MNQEDYPSDSDASDEDFRPDKEESNTGSESGSEDDEVPENNEESKGTKRKRKGSTVRAKKVKAASKAAEETNENNVDELDEEEEKRRTDALWASFLGGDTNAKESSTSSKSNSISGGTSSKKEELKTKQTVKPSPTLNSKPQEKEKPTVAQLFEFAGEQVVVSDEGSKSDSPADAEKATSRPAVSAVSSFPRRSGSSGGGLGAVLNQINKKNKLTTLEKTKLDWTSFKQNEGIAEELQTHNKGKDGFLERRDFLERTDLRQFEIEKSFRQTKRSNR
ncbi:craniofacial development protein 1 [Anopheles ziemanni]|uniref:craniofacial development protein 1 n=1 Tax=Anopheles coustani TaxID=139045 RepID=UPI002657F345|nr:craniofacial development protein 1 [Anopheles coustani]XP_058179023.1 craniofacial development protein 1 [Anopheles ziemanni]